MKTLTATLLASLFILSTISAPSRAASSAAAIEDCTCSARDNSCSASITCRGGCVTWCDVDGDCFAECSGFLQTFSMETTLQMRDATYPQLITELARISGKDLLFDPLKPDVTFNAEYKRALLWDVLDMLSERGKLQIARQDFERLKKLRRVLLSGTKISLCVHNTPVNTFVNDLASVTGLSLRVVDGDPLAIVNVKLQDVSLSDIVVRVSGQTGARIKSGVDLHSP